MRMYRMVFLGLILLLCGSNGYAADLSARAWQRDFDTIRDQLMVPLKEKFEKAEKAGSLEGIEEEWREYINAYTKELRELRASLDTDSYQIVRDVLFTASENFSSAAELSKCKQAPTWRQAQKFVYANLDLIGNLIATMDN